MPPNSLGDCGAHNPAWRAFSWIGASFSSGIFSCSEKFSRSDSSGSTWVSTKLRVRWRNSSISGERVKSMRRPPAVLDQSGNSYIAWGLYRSQRRPGKPRQTHEADDMKRILWTVAGAAALLLLRAAPGYAGYG